MKKKNSIIIFDWDDTLLPTSFLTPGGVFDENIKLREIDNEKLLNLERAVLKLLTEAVEKGNVYIITNAGNGWVEYSANRFYPSIMPILEKIKIISARGQYEKMFPGNSRQWKIEAFLNLLKNVNMKLVTNIICIGDSLFEMEAGRILASKFTEAFIKTKNKK
jgi:FMN phosphatase YigB (HAD superfamily)